MIGWLLPGRVDAVCVLVAREGVGVEGPEDVTDPGAGDSLQHSPTLPDTEGHLQVLASPHVHLLVVAAQLPEGVSVNSKQSWGTLIASI